MQTLVQDVENMLAASLVGRKAEIRVLLRAAIANENVFLYGPPGTAKSLLLESFAKAFGATSFVMLCNKYTTPEEVIGPGRISKLKNDELERNLTGRMADSQFVLLDEIWKASSAIINAMLRLMNEGVVENGFTQCKTRIQTIKTPMRMALSASNEFPDGDELAAAYDRFLVRRHVRYVQKSDRAALCFSAFTPPKQVATIDDLDRATKQAMALQFTDSARTAFLNIIGELEDKGIVIGDRRMMKSMKIAQSEAWMQGHSEVQPEDLEPLTDVFWSSLDQHPVVNDIVIRHSNPTVLMVNAFIKEVSELTARIANLKDSSELNVAMGRAERIKEDLSRIATTSEKVAALIEACDEICDVGVSKKTGVELKVVRALRVRS